MKRFPRIRRDIISIVPIQNMSGKWESGTTEHTKECHEQFDWLHLKTVRISPYMYERKIREALEKNKLKTINEKDKTFTVLKNILNLKNFFS